MTTTAIERRWTAADIPDLHGRVAIVTGASSGVGFELALELARHRAHVVVASRDEGRTREAATRISAAVPDAAIEARGLDLSSLASVRRFADEVSGQHPAVDILVNNAGVAGGPRRETSDGFEMHFQVNHLGHFALTGLLWPSLAARGGRVVSISSEVASSGTIDFDDLQTTRGYTFVKAYAQSKLANLLFALELERRCRAARVAIESFACHPGVAKSNLFIGKDIDWGRAPRGKERLIRFVQILLAQTAAMSALPALYVATDPSARPENYVGPAGFVHGRGYPGFCSLPRAARDEAAAARLWDVSARLSGVIY